MWPYLIAIHVTVMTGASGSSRVRKILSKQLKDPHVAKRCSSVPAYDTSFSYFSSSSFFNITLPLAPLSSFSFSCCNFFCVLSSSISHLFLLFSASRTLLLKILIHSLMTMMVFGHVLPQLLHCLLPNHLTHWKTRKKWRTKGRSRWMPLTWTQLPYLLCEWSIVCHFCIWYSVLVCWLVLPWLTSELMVCVVCEGLK